MRPTRRQTPSVSEKPWLVRVRPPCVTPTLTATDALSNVGGWPYAHGAVAAKRLHADPFEVAVAPDGAINPASLAIDKTAVRDIIDMVVNEDRKVIAAVHKEKERIAHGVEIIAHALRKGGRIVFVGAGTSGRLGVVEAAEMPPTFGTAPRLVQAIMAGGQDAVFQAKEGVEDNYEEGGRSIARLRLTNRDVVIGVSASGITPFVRGALTRGRKAGVKIIFVTCWPGSELQNFVDLIIAPAVGPEIIAGSTRLKAGTATKMVLNMLTTVAMIKVGKTYGNLMVDVKTGSEKLKDRARRIVGVVTGIDYEAADGLLKRASGTSRQPS